MERQARVPRVDIVERLARALGVPAGWLAFGAELPFSPTELLGCEGMGARLASWRAARALVYVENGQVMPTLDTAERLARSLGVSPSWLAFGEGSQDA
jgi:hypothetical protein